MNVKAPHESTLDFILSVVLRIGLALSIFTVLIGGGLFLWEHAGEAIDYRIFTGEPASLMGIKTILTSAYRDRSLAIVQLGIILLVATPVTRVASCILVFLKERDFLYVGLASFVLIVLLISLF